MALYRGRIRDYKRPEIGSVGIIKCRIKASRRAARPPPSVALARGAQACSKGAVPSRSLEGRRGSLLEPRRYIDTQIYKYTNTPIHRYINTKLQIF